MRVHVKNFQSLADASLDVEGLTVLVGPSDLGKSALVRAIEGALFNEPGDYFVRSGATNAEVTLTGVPAADGQPLDVVWRKGRTKNQFVVDGALFDKVGSVSPPPILAAGYRDVGTDDPIRPQVAGQFDRVFLLDRPGSVVASILTALSRVMVVSAADRLCAVDARDTKRQETTRRADLAKLDADIQTAAPIDALHQRVGQIRHDAEIVRQLHQRAQALAQLVAARTALRVGLRPSLPAPPALEAVPSETYERAQPLVAQRPALVRALRDTLPTLTHVPPLDVPALGARPLIATRARCVQALSVPLPVKALDALKLDAFRPEVEFERAAGAVAARAGALTDLRVAMGTEAAARGNAEEAMAAFEAQLAESPVCPLCGSEVERGRG